MDFGSARRAVLQLLGTTAPADVPALLHWMRTTRDFDELTRDNRDAVLKNVADDLRCRLPPEAVLGSEQRALQKIRQQPEPTVHVDAFLYDEDVIDSLCEEGKMSRNFCTVCGSHRTAPLGFISHSFSLMELKFIYLHVLPDLSGKLLVDIGSRLGTVLYGVKSSFVLPVLHELILLQVLHADICTQGPLLQSADVIVMNNVFEYFLTEAEQARAWNYIIQNVRKQGSLLVTVPSLQDSLVGLEINVQLSSWVEEIPLDLDVYPERDIDREALEQIHLYKVL
uniref:RIKEN cDNA 2700097O09 gene n=1 Tax=Peromyscus maniculatus bairdii TaxID=230844 RepID=A0A8C8TZK3_PERMB